MNNTAANISAQNATRTLTPEVPRSILESRMSELEGALVDMDKTVCAAIDRFSPLIVSLGASDTEFAKEQPKTLMAPHIDAIERLTSHANAIRVRLQDALNNAQI